MAAAVHIRKEAFLIMLWAAAETFKKECLGILLGSAPSPQRKHFLITDAVPLQVVKRRLNTKVEQGKKSVARWQEFWSRMPFNPKKIGDFHSHPEWGPYKPSDELSGRDIQDALTYKLPIQILISVSSQRGDASIWKITEDGSINGSLGRFSFRVNAYTLIDGADGQPQPTKLPIVSPLALAKLNRIQHKIVKS